MWRKTFVSDLGNERLIHWLIAHGFEGQPWLLFSFSFWPWVRRICIWPPPWRRIGLQLLSFGPLTTKVFRKKPSLPNGCGCPTRLKRHNKSIHGNSAMFVLRCQHVLSRETLISQKSGGLQQERVWMINWFSN